MAWIRSMPAYDYRCTVCGREMEIVHAISEPIAGMPHSRLDDDKTPCEGPLERLVSLAGYNRSGVGQKPPSDGQLLRAGFSKYVRGSNGYEKALGPPGSPDFIQRE
jgi:putative FmdB family regulatory protein